jgi:hypothetical protein
LIDTKLTFRLIAEGDQLAKLDENKLREFVGKMLGDLGG